MTDRTFSLRIISCDYCQEKPIRGLDEMYSKFRASEIETVPVIRIFGITPSGQKSCMHVHGVFPYLSVPYFGQMGDILHQYMQELALNIDNTLNIASNKGKKLHVNKIQLKMAIPYYGYHVEEQPFLQIFFFSPVMMKKATELLNNGSIMNTFLQPHEAHIPYILQFFIDFNLFGMNYIHTKNVRFRIFPNIKESQPLTTPLSQTCATEDYIPQNADLWEPKNLPTNMVLGENVQRQSNCELEVDCSSVFIQNQLDASACSGGNPGLAAIWADEKKRHREVFNDSKITPPVSQERVNVCKTASEEFFQAKFIEKMNSISLSLENKDLSFNQSSSQFNKSFSSEMEDLQFLELFRDILDGEESDSILSTQKSDKNSQTYKNVCSDDESDDSLEMSQVFLHDIDNDEADNPTSSGSSFFQLAQNEPEKSDSRLSTVDEQSDSPGCSFWLPQLDGMFDQSDSNSSSGLSNLLILKRKRGIRKSNNDNTRQRRLSRSKVTTTFVNDTGESTNMIEMENQKRVLRQRVSKMEGSSYCLNQHKKQFKYFINPNDFLQKLPPKATDVIFSNNLKIPNYININDLKRLGTETVLVKAACLKPEKLIVDQVVRVNETLPAKSKINIGRKVKSDQELIPSGQSLLNQPLRLRSKSRQLQSLKSVPKIEGKVNVEKEDIVDNQDVVITGDDTNSRKDSKVFTEDKQTTISIDVPDCQSRESPINIYHSDTMWKLAYMSPKSPIEEVISSPPCASSPYPFKEETSSDSELKDSRPNSSPNSDADITLFLDTSDDEDVDKDHDRQRSDEFVGRKIVGENKLSPKLDLKEYEIDSEESDDTVILTDDNRLPPPSSTTEGECTLISSLINTSIYSFDNMDVSVSDLETSQEAEHKVNDLTEDTGLSSRISNVNISSQEGTVDLISKDDLNEDTIEYEILVAPPPPTRSEVENGGFDVQKIPDSTNKIDKQGYTSNPYDLEEYEGSFSGALAKVKRLFGLDFVPDFLNTFRDGFDRLTPLIQPPSYKDVENWCLKNLNTLVDAEEVKRMKIGEIPKLDNSPSSKTFVFDKDAAGQSTPLALQSSSRLKTNNKTLRKKSTNFSIQSILMCDGKGLVSPILDGSDKSSLRPILEDPSYGLTPKRNNDSMSVIEGVTQNSSVQSPSIRKKFDQRNNHFDFITVMSLEVHCQTRQNLKPNPKLDEITAIFYCVQNQSPPLASVPELSVGAIIVEKLDCEDNVLPSRDSESSGSKSVFSSQESKCNLKNKPKYGDSTIHLYGCDCLPKNVLNIITVATEKDLFGKLVKILSSWDPDIIVGYEIEMLSWGYVLERASFLDEDLCGALSRIPKSRSVGATRSKSRMRMLVEDLDSDNIPDIKVTGRIVLNIWKIMRKEVALTSYTFENVFYQVLNKRVPLFEHKTLTEFFTNPKLRWNLYDYYVIRVCGWIQLLDHFNIIGRTSELARIFGIQFFEVFSRGSQFRVESMMLRMVKASNFIAVSPGIQQRAHMKAPESLPLILEPESKFYTDPVLVLDFQSLYPSIIIAYNYCYSTCLGRVEFLGSNDPFEFGCTSLSIPVSEQKKLTNKVTISPVGIAFVKPIIKQGIIPKMLQEILETRIMVKKSMKDNKDNKSAVKLLDARQLGLKLIANVTFGYTAANYSGRMPCVEISDSILSKSRETLQNAIKFVETNPKWGAHIVYGDTDSMFVRLPGRCKEQAFKIGEEIADAVTALNPSPVKLKFEKVYLPCVLQTKKRYVGYMYETVDQIEPVFDAKGIETVRRDSCPAVSKILEKSLRLLFTNRDTKPVKLYVQRQFQKILSDRTSIQDLIFAKEFRGINGYRPTAHVPALVLARRLLQSDPRAEPRVGERVPYVITYGEPGLPLIKLVRQPQELLNDNSLRINSQYYVTRVVIPPLERIFCLLGVSVNKWLSELPRTLFANINKDIGSAIIGKTSLPQYFTRIQCVVCEGPSDSGFCVTCKNNPQMTVITLGSRINGWDTTKSQLRQICQSCTGISVPNTLCHSLDCPVLFRLALARKNESQRNFVQAKIDLCNVEF